MPGCVFCDVVTGNDSIHEVWWEDSENVAFLNPMPNRRGHTLLIPKVHIENLFDIDREPYFSLMQAAHNVGNEMRAFYKLPRVALIVEGLGVAHVHVHLIPVRKQGDLGVFNQYEPKDGELKTLGEELRSFVN